MTERNDWAVVMGIVNVTPDSFYDGGRHDDTYTAVEHAQQLVIDGADIIDIGGASSRPGAKPLPDEEEAARVVPVIRELAGRGINVPMSVDTTSSVVAEAAVRAGASWVNDVSAGRFDPAMPDTVARLGCTVVLTHSRGTPQTMQDCPKYGDVVGEVVAELRTAIDKFKSAGVRDEKIVVDPGFGFAKNVDHNLALLGGLDDVVMRLGYPVLVGVSRKSFVGAITGRSVKDRLGGTLGATAVAYQNGVRIFRVHDVRETVDFFKMLLSAS